MKLNKGRGRGVGPIIHAVIKLDVYCDQIHDSQGNVLFLIILYEGGKV